jgi:hypothetical protein
MFIHYRQQAIDQMANPDDADLLMVEWSADPAADPMDRATWEESQPLWDSRRYKVMTSQQRVMDEDSFRSQFLNQWVGARRGWITKEVWAGCYTEAPFPERGGVLAVEASTAGSQVGVIHAAMEGDEVYVRAWVFESYTAAWQFLEQRATAHRVNAVVHHESLRLPTLRSAKMIHVRATDQIAGYLPTRTLIMDQTLHHYGQPALNEQVLQANIHRTGEGRDFLSQKYTPVPIYLARAMVWAVGHLVDPRNQARRASVITT